nr:hypothetical conserved protein [uncultured Gammaproteobacteria bacterium]
MSLLWAEFAFGLEEDSAQPVYIEANSAYYDKKIDQSTYTGNVVLVQGSLHLQADKLVAYSPGGKVEKVVAYGNPVRFRQQPKPGAEEIRGQSKQAEYYMEKKYIVLIGEAVVWQGKNEYTSDRIEYDQINDIVKAGEASSDAKRVKIILHPKTESSPPPKKQ